MGSRRRIVGHAEDNMVPEQPLSWRHSVAVTVSLCSAAAAIIVYATVVSTTFDETFWAWSLFAFIVTLVVRSAGNLLLIKGHPKGRVLCVAAYLSFPVTASLILAATAYRFEGMKVALLAGAMWFLLLVFLCVRDVGHKRF